MIRVAGVKRYCLIGDPVEHSLSPKIMNFLFKKHGLDAIYFKIRVGNNELKNKIMEFRDQDFKGFNVTMPLKQSIIKYLDEINKDAKLIKAVNTVKNTGNYLIGYNTDWIGFMNSLKLNGVKRIDKAVILGAGGAARAATYALIKNSTIVYILNRSRARAEALAKEFGEINDNVVALDLNMENLERALDESMLLVNATPVGMNEWKSLVPCELLREDLVVMDMVYSPLTTKLLHDARNAGAKTIDGLWMLILQAAESFRIWTGIYPDVHEVRALLLGE